jgi:hypothetical protein
MLVHNHSHIHYIGRDNWSIGTLLRLLQVQEYWRARGFQKKKKKSAKKCGLCEKRKKINYR